jgi:hypothetical protein
MLLFSHGLKWHLSPHATVFSYTFKPIIKNYEKFSNIYLKKNRKLSLCLSITLWRCVEADTRLRRLVSIMLCPPLLQCLLDRRMGGPHFVGAVCVNVTCIRRVQPTYGEANDVSQHCKLELKKSSMCWKHPQLKTQTYTSKIIVTVFFSHQESLYVLFPYITAPKRLPNGHRNAARCSRLVLLADCTTARKVCST